MHRVTQLTDEGVVLKPDNGEEKRLIAKDMYVGKEVIAFPFIGAMIRSVNQKGRWGVGLLAVIMIVIGCMPLHSKSDAVYETQYLKRESFPEKCVGVTKFPSKPNMDEEIQCFQGLEGR